eukprot:jgi/Galph1/2963/GphlegSOOS_G1602.1
MKAITPNKLLLLRPVNHCSVCFIGSQIMGCPTLLYKGTRLFPLWPKRKLSFFSTTARSIQTSILTNMMGDVKQSNLHQTSGSPSTIPTTASHVRTVAETVSDFLHYFPQPIPFIYRSIVQELLVTTHLARVTAGFEYNKVFALGYDMVTQIFFKSYPKAEDKPKLFSSISKALLLDYEQLKKDANSLVDWTKERTEAQILQVIEEGGQDEISQMLHSIRHNEWFVYSRLFGLGLIRMMELVSNQVTTEMCAKWATALNISLVKLQQEFENYQSSVEKLKQAEQLFAELEARQKKKMAERLAEKAKRAQEEAMKAEEEASEESLSSSN